VLKLKIVITAMLILIVSGCQSKSGMNPHVPENFTFRFVQSGGITGMSAVLLLTDTDSLSYRSQNFKVSHIITADQRDAIFQLLKSNEFFEMDSIYFPDHIVADDIYITLTYDSGIRNHTVSTSAYCGGGYGQNCTWPTGLSTIIDSLNQWIGNLKTEITQGCVSISHRYSAEAWPFENTISLKDSISTTFEIADTVYRTVREAENASPEIRFYEGEWVYRMNTTIQTGTPFNDFDTTLTIHGRSQPARWKFAPPLNAFPESGIRISGTEYSWVDSVYTNMRYPRYFADSPLNPDIALYELKIVHGNDCP